MRFSKRTIASVVGAVMISLPSAQLAAASEMDGSATPQSSLSTVYGALSAIASRNGLMSTFPSSANTGTPTAQSAGAPIAALIRSLPAPTFYSQNTHQSDPTAEELALISHTVEPESVMHPWQDVINDMALPTDESLTSLIDEVSANLINSTEQLLTNQPVIDTQISTSTSDNTTRELLSSVGIESTPSAAISSDGMLTVNYAGAGLSIPEAQSDMPGAESAELSLPLNDQSHFLPVCARTPVATPPVDSMSAISESVTGRGDTAAGFVIASSAQTELSEEGGVVNIVRGDVLLHPAHALAIKSQDVVIELRAGSIAQVISKSDALIIRSCSGPGHLRVKVGAHRISLAPGEELIVSAHSIVPDHARRRVKHIELQNGLYATLSEFPMESIFSTSQHTRGLLASSSTFHKSFVDKVLKTAAAVRLATKGHGQYSTRVHNQ